MNNLILPFTSENAGVLSDHADLLFRVLSESHLACAKADLQRLTPTEWIGDVRVVNAYHACNIVRVGVENEVNKGSDNGTDIQPPPVVLRLCYLVAGWATLFIQSTRALEPNGGSLVNTKLLDPMGVTLWTILLSSFVKSTMQRPSFPLFETIVTVYIRLARESTELVYNSLPEAHYITIIKDLFLHAGRTPRDSHPDSIWTAMELHADELVGIAIGKITSYVNVFSRNMDLPWIHIVGMLQYVESILKIPAIRREMTARGMLPLLCQLFYHVTHERIDIMAGSRGRGGANPRDSLTCIIRAIHHFLQGGQPSATVALEARLLPSLFRTQPLLEESGEVDSTSITNLRHSVEQVIFSLERQLFYRSTLQVFFKSDRFIERLRASGSISQGVLWPMIARLRSLAEKRREEMVMVKTSRVACANWHVSGSPRYFDRSVLTEWPSVLLWQRTPTCTSSAAWAVSRLSIAHIDVAVCIGRQGAIEVVVRKFETYESVSLWYSWLSQTLTPISAGSTLAPIPTRDMNFIYHLVIQEMERRQAEVLEVLRQCQDTLQVYPSGALRGSPETHPDDWIFADIILVFDFSPLIPLDSLHFPEIQFTVSYTDTFPDLLTREPYYCDFDDKRFQKIVRTRRSRGPFIAIISRSKLLDLTNMDCIVNRVYSF